MQRCCSAILDKVLPLSTLLSMRFLSTAVFATCICSIKALIVIDNEAILADARTSFLRLQTDTNTLANAVTSYDGTDHVTTSDPTTLTQKIEITMLDASSLTNMLDIASTDGVNGTVSDLIASYGMTYYNQYLMLIDAAYNNRATLVGDRARLQDMGDLNIVIINLLIGSEAVGPNDYDAQYAAAISELKGVNSAAVSYLENSNAKTSSTVGATSIRAASATKRRTALVTQTRKSTSKIVTSISAPTPILQPLPGTSILAIPANTPSTLTPTTSSQATSIASSTVSSFTLKAIQTGSIYSSDPSVLSNVSINLNGEQLSFTGTSPVFTILTNGSLSDRTNLYFSNTQTQSNFGSAVPVGYDTYGNPHYSSSDHPGNSLLQAEPPTYLPNYLGMQLFSIDDDDVLSLTIGGVPATFYRCYYRDGNYLYAVLPIYHTSAMDSACYKLTLVAGQS